MKGIRSLAVILVILVGIFLVWRFSERRGQEQYLFPDFEPQMAQRVSLKSGDTETTLERVNDVWVVTSEDSFPAEVEAVGNMFDELAGFSERDRISSNPEKQSIFQVDSTGILVSIEDAQGKEMASFILGKVGSDYQSTYVRKASSNNVILAPGYLRPIFDRGKRSWQDKTIYQLEPGGMIEIGVDRPEESVVLARNDVGEWYLSQPDSEACDNQRVSRLVRTIAYLKCEDFAGRRPVAGSGIDAADSSLWFRTSDGNEDRLIFGSQSDAKRIHAARQSGDIVYLLAPHKVAALMPKLAELRMKEVPEQEE